MTICGICYKASTQPKLHPTRLWLQNGMKLSSQTLRNFCFLNELLTEELSAICSSRFGHTESLSYICLSFKKKSFINWNPLNYSWNYKSINPHPNFPISGFAHTRAHTHTHMHHFVMKPWVLRLYFPLKAINSWVGSTGRGERPFSWQGNGRFHTAVSSSNPSAFYKRRLCWFSTSKRQTSQWPYWSSVHSLLVQRDKKEQHKWLSNRTNETPLHQNLVHQSLFFCKCTHAPNGLWPSPLLQGKSVFAYQTALGSMR